RSRTSGENLFDLLMAQSSQSVEPPRKPGRFRTPYEQRALAPGSRSEGYHEYEVIKALPVTQGDIARAFGQPGGGVQILPRFPDRVNIEWLLDNKFLKGVDK
ncbi:TNT domain-containing protein, partial [Xanthomonas albilineans]|uniref:TNT domain-containing protein n=1 Tax=Xanthomonas albilineans TaxID=29447 RepID=UPI001E283BA2